MGLKLPLPFASEHNIRYPAVVHRLSTGRPAAFPITRKSERPFYSYRSASSCRGVLPPAYGGQFRDGGDDPAFSAVRRPGASREEAARPLRPVGRPASRREIQGQGRPQRRRGGSRARPGRVQGEKRARSPAQRHPSQGSRRRSAHTGAFQRHPGQLPAPKPPIGRQARAPSRDSRRNPLPGRVPSRPTP